MTELKNHQIWPEIVDFTLVNYCNLDCIFCHSAVYDFGKPDHLKLKYITQNKQLFENVKTVTLFNQFEPLVYPDFINLFNYLCEFECETYFSTNGLAFTPEVINTIVGRLTYLTISLSTLQYKRYKTLYGRDVLHRVLENIAEIVKCKNKKKTSFPKLRIMMVFMAGNKNEIFDIIDLAKKYRFEEGVAINFFISHRSNLNHENPLSLENKTSTYAIIKQAIEYARKEEVKLIIQAGSEKNLTEKKSNEIKKMGHLYCSEPFKRASIGFDGIVKACSVAVEPLGNIKTEPFEQIWNGELFKNFRKAVNSDSPPQSCKNCWHCRYGGQHITGDYSLHDVNIMNLPKKTSKTGY